MTANDSVQIRRNQSAEPQPLGRIACPDCGKQSPPVPNAIVAAAWLAGHLQEMTSSLAPASGVGASEGSTSVGAGWTAPRTPAPAEHEQDAS